MRTTEVLRLSPEVEAAVACGRPLVALESTVIAHGLPYPTNLEVARRMEEIVRAQGATPATIALLGGRLCVGLEIVRAQGATPATIALLGGRLCVGLSQEELAHLATASGIRKTSRRDLPIVHCCLGRDPGFCHRRHRRRASRRTL